jgi:SAM-dependent methyltransferase
MLFRLQTNLGVRPGLTVRSCAVQELVPELAGSFDSVVSSNVLEHIPDDAERAVIRATYELLKSGGTSIHWVPACPSVFGALDRSFGHQRRYTKAGLAGRFEQAGFKVVKCRYWNSVGLAGWWWQGKARKAQHIRPSAALCYDRFVVPVLRRVEPWVWLPAGQSLCIVARKP